MTEQFANTPATTLFAAVAATTPTLSVTTTGGFPSSGDFRLRVDNELMLATAVSSVTFTVTRGIEGTTPAAHRKGSLVRHVLTAGSLAALSTDTLAQVSDKLSHEEFVPVTGGVNVSLAHTASVVLMVSRNGLIQSATAGDYTVLGATISFSPVFTPGERVVVAYSHGLDSPVGAQLWVLPPRARARSHDYSFSHVATTPT